MRSSQQSLAGLAFAAGVGLVVVLVSNTGCIGGASGLVAAALFAGTTGFKVVVEEAGIPDFEVAGLAKELFEVEAPATPFAGTDSDGVAGAVAFSLFAVAAETSEGVHTKRSSDEQTHCLK